MAMNRRRLVLMAAGLVAALLMLSGAYMQMAMLSAAGQIVAFAAVGLMGIMLSRQMAWSASAQAAQGQDQSDRFATIDARIRDLKGDLSKLLVGSSGHAEGLRGASRHLESILARTLAQAEEAPRAVRHLDARISEASSRIAQRMDVRLDRISASSADVQASLSEVRAEVRRLELAHEQTGGEAASAAADVQASLSEIRAEVRKLELAHEQTGDEAASAANLTMRAFRDISERVRAQGEEFVKRFELLQILTDNLDAQTEAFGSIREIRAAIAEPDGEMRTIQTEVERLHARYDAEKAAFLEFLSDERKMRALSQMSMQWLKTESVREVEALNQLRLLLQVEEATPLLGGWAMDATAIHALVEMILADRPRRIVELGSGSSTVWIACALRKLGEGRVISYDHLPSYRDRTAATIDRLGLTSFAEVKLAELKEIDLAQGRFDWYDIDKSEIDGPIDILLIDGPPGGTGPMARFPALPVLKDMLAPGAVIIIDDANREGERGMIRLWQEAFVELVGSDLLGPRTKTFRIDPGADGRSMGS